MDIFGVFTHQKGELNSDNTNSSSKLKNGGDKRAIRNQRVRYALCIVTAVAFAIRFHNFGIPRIVSWDEVHFGKFASFYINGTAFFDLHPPAGKMLIAAFGYLTGYDGTVSFTNPGDVYGEDKSVMGMRAGCTLLGAFVVPFSFMVVLEKSGSLTAAILAAVFLAFDTGLVVLTRYILLDPITIFFMSASALGEAKFRNCRNTFGKEWFGWLFFTGFMLGGAITTKHVGAFIIAYVGLCTVHHLWEIFGDKKVSYKQFSLHFLARSVALILIPVLMYIAMFVLHFSIATHDSDARESFTPKYRVQFINSSYNDKMIEKYVTYHTDIKIDSHQPGSGYIHSHTLNFPSVNNSPRQQMVTGYFHEDPNNYWFFKPWDKNAVDDHIVRHGDLVVLEHRVTGRNLHSHKVPSVISTQHYQVSGYGWRGVGDANDIWRVEIKNGKLGDPVESFSSEIYLRHYNLGCLLSYTGYGLPVWAYNQLEIVCSSWDAKLAKKTTKGFSSFNIHPLIEEVENRTLPATARSSIPVEMINTKDIGNDFWTKFKLLHQMVFYSNKILGKENDGKLSNLRQDAYEFPMNWAAQPYSGTYNETKLNVYLLGHPVLWGFNLMLIFCLPLIIPAAIISQRHVIFQDESGTLTFDRRMVGAGWMLVGWSLHYLPFFMMPRVLYIHHYYPASIWMCCFTAIFLDRLTVNLSNRIKRLLLSMVILVTAGIFLMFSPLVYGFSGPKAQNETSTYHYLWWYKHWGI